MTRILPFVLVAVCCFVIWSQTSLAGGVAQCPASGCVPAVPGESLVSKITVTRNFLGDNPVWEPVEYGFGTLAGPNLTLQFEPGFVLEYSVDPHGDFATRLLDGGPFDPNWSLNGTNNASRPSQWLSKDATPNALALTINQSQVFTDTVYRAFDVDSSVTLANGIDLAGMNLHLTRFKVSTGQWQPADNGATVDIVIELFGAAGAVPEPSAFVLAMVSCMWPGLRAIRRPGNCRGRG